MPPPNDGIAVSYTQEEVEQTRYFQQYGFLPELIARFDRIVPFSALDEDALSQILRRNLVSSFQKEFALAGISLHVDESLLHHIVRQALKRETGARGLRSVLAQLLEDTAFRVYSEKSVKSVRIAWTDHGLHVEQT